MAYEARTRPWTLSRRRKPRLAPCGWWAGLGGELLVAQPIANECGPVSGYADGSQPLEIGGIFNVIDGPNMKLAAVAFAQLVNERLVDDGGFPLHAYPISPATSNGLTDLASIRCPLASLLVVFETSQPVSPN